MTNLEFDWKPLQGDELNITGNLLRIIGLFLESRISLDYLLIFSKV